MPAAKRSSKPGPKNITEAMLKAALKRHNGSQAAAAAQLGIARSSIHQRIQSNPTLKQFLLDNAEAIVDMAESVVVHHLKKKDSQMARYVLDRKGRDRGYTQEPPPAIPPPPPNDDRRQLVVNVLIQSLAEREKAIHAVQVKQGIGQEGRPTLKPGALSGAVGGAKAEAEAEAARSRIPAKPAR